ARRAPPRLAAQARDRRRHPARAREVVALARDRAAGAAHRRGARRLPVSAGAGWSDRGAPRGVGDRHPRASGWGRAGGRAGRLRRRRLHRGERALPLTARTPEVFVVGAGPVATALSGALRHAGVPVLGLWGRDPAKVRAAGAVAGVGTYSAA